MAFTVDPNCGFLKNEAYMTRTWIFFGKEEWTPESYEFRAAFRGRACAAPYRLSKEELELATSQQRHTPILLLTMGQRHWWWFCDTFYYTNESCQEPLVIKGLLIQKQQRDSRKEERARATANGQPPPKRTRTGRNSHRHVPPATTTLQNSYSILGVSPNTSFLEVKAAYRKKITEYHPDKVAALGSELKKLAEEMTKQINNAYDELYALHCRGQ